jgi:hypothetical protein
MAISDPNGYLIKMQVDMIQSLVDRDLPTFERLFPGYKENSSFIDCSTDWTITKAKLGAAFKVKFVSFCLNH